MDSISHSLCCTAEINTKLLSNYTPIIKKNRKIGKENVACIYNKILLSHKEEVNNGICSNMDRPRNCHTE